MENKSVPPWFMETATAKIQELEKAWNSLDPEVVGKYFASDIEMIENLKSKHGIKRVKSFFKNKWKKELAFELKMELWGFRNNRMAVRTWANWKNAKGQTYKSMGNELLEFDVNGLIIKRISSYHFKTKSLTF